MKNREIINRRLEKSEGQVEKLYFFLQRGGTQEQVEDTLRDLREAIQEAKSFLQQEPFGPNEINKY
jgi:predicted Zn-dependent peptidase